MLAVLRRSFLLQLLVLALALIAVGASLWVEPAARASSPRALTGRPLPPTPDGGPGGRRGFRGRLL
jgi:hypothetical protein